MENLESLKVADLKKELKTRGLAILGSKAELLLRLQEAMATEKAALDDSVLDDDSAILDEDDEDVLSDGDSDDELVDLATKNGRPLEPLSTSPKKSGAVSPLAAAAEAENGEAEDEALPPKKRKKIQINRDAVSTEVATDSELIPAATESATKVPEVATPAKKHTPITAPESDGPKEKVVKLSAEALAATDKAKLRQEKFGAVTKDVSAKTKAVAPVVVAAGAVISEKAKKRLEKFGGPPAVATVGKVSLTAEDEAKLTKRKERFGAIDVSDSKAPDTPAANGQKEKRAARFGLGTEISTPEIEAKKKARAARFGGGT